MNKKALKIMENISDYLFITFFVVSLVFYVFGLILVFAASGTGGTSYSSGLAGYFSHISFTPDNIALRMPYSIPFVINTIINGDGCFFITTQLALLITIILKKFKWKHCHELSIFLALIQVVSFASITTAYRLPLIEVWAFLHEAYFIYPILLLVIFIPISIFSYISNINSKDFHYFNKLFKSFLIISIIICFLSMLSSFYFARILVGTNNPQDEFVKSLYDTYAKNPLNIVFSAPGTVRSTLYVSLVLSIVFGVIYKIKSRKEKLLEKSC